MAVDKKSDYVGDHGGRYTDLDGNTKQFTYVDHDVKSKLSMPITKKEADDARQWLKDYREKIITEILELPAAALPVSHNFRFSVFRDAGETEFTWNETMLRDPSIEIELLQDMRKFTKLYA